MHLNLLRCFLFSACCCLPAWARDHLPPACPFHAKDVTSAVRVLRQYFDHKMTASCEFLSLAFDPTSDDPRLIGSALALADVRSFYLAPEFRVGHDSRPDERVAEIMDAVIENEHITTLGLWQTHFSDASVSQVARVMSANERITALSIEVW